jgi:hypothetical protein
MKRLLRQLLLRGWILAGFFGALFFLVVAGPGPLDVTNERWVFHHNDSATAQIGWTFYRFAPWSPRIALNPTYGMDFGGSIIFSDAVPLFAIFFKALSPILPETFQYFGLWVFASFVLQGAFGWMLMSRATENAAARVLGACLISLTPLYCFRLVSPLSAHMSLTAHWPILAALCLCLPPHARRPWLWWGLLLVATAFIHIYTFAMVATLWGADIMRRLILDPRTAWPEPVGIIGIVAAAVLLTGVWAGPASDYHGGFGWFKMNVFAFIDPHVWRSPGLRPWSLVLPDIPNWGGDYEGFAFLGLGGLLLVAVGAWAGQAMIRTRAFVLVVFYLPLGAVLVGMGIFALSHNVTFGNINFFVPWPAPLESLGRLFRSTGRFIWPLYYFVFFAAVLLISRRVSPRMLTTIVASAAIIQCIDIAPAWSSANSYLRERGPAYQSKLIALFWKEVGRQYGAVRIAPHKNQHPDYFEVAIMARAAGLATDATYLSRPSASATNDSRTRIDRAIATGVWPSDTLFVVDEDIARRASRTLDQTRHLIAHVDGLIVIAPDWRGCSDCGAVPFR